MRGRIGSEAKSLIEQIEEVGKRFFKVKDAAQLAGKNYHAARMLLDHLTRAGWVVRVERGLYAIAPGEGEVLNPLVVGRELVGDDGYYVSHGSAMAVWGMGNAGEDKPGGHKARPYDRVVVTLMGERRMRARMALGVRYLFVSEQVLGERRMGMPLRSHAEPWMRVKVEVSLDEWVWVSDPEWTIVSGLARPELCGGVEEVARGLEIWKERVNLERLVGYARVVKNRTACRRLGYLLDVLGMQTMMTELDLGFAVFNSYGRLEPGRDWVRDWERKWMLDVNEEIGKKL